MFPTCCMMYSLFTLSMDLTFVGTNQNLNRKLGLYQVQEDINDNVGSVYMYTNVAVLVF